LRHDGSFRAADNFRIATLDRLRGQMCPFSPLPQTSPIVMPGTLSGNPARINACRAGFWPTPAVSTCPMITWEI
jgi:hypothetical protein